MTRRNCDTKAVELRALVSNNQNHPGRPPTGIATDVAMTPRRTGSYVHTDSFVISFKFIPHSSSGNGFDLHRGAPGTGPRNGRSHVSTSSKLLSPSPSGDKDSVAGCFRTTTSGKLLSSGHGLGRHAPSVPDLESESSSSVSVSVATHTGLPAVRSTAI